MVMFEQRVSMTKFLSIEVIKSCETSEVIIVVRAKPELRRAWNGLELDRSIATLLRLGDCMIGGANIHRLKQGSSGLIG